MKINFILAPFKEVIPWGDPPKQSLHWFGLTDGQYWIDVGDQTLFEVTEETCEALGCARYCDYQVARLYEDLIDMVPSVLEPLPLELVPYVSGDSAKAWDKTLTQWCNREDSELDDAYWNTMDLAVTWRGQRCLDTGHLASPTDIRMWSDQDNVYIEWDHCTPSPSRKYAWTATKGSTRVTRAKFLAEIRSFHDRLIGEMAQRCNEVVTGALSSSIQIDFDGLLREQNERAQILDSVLQRPPMKTDWHAVLKALKHIELE
jgi:hypothetical protein